MIVKVLFIAAAFCLGWFFGGADGYAKGYDDGSRRRSMGGRIWR